MIVIILLFIFIELFYNVESKIIFGSYDSGNNKTNIHSHTTFEHIQSINISKNALNLKSCHVFLNLSQTNFNFWKICHLTFIQKYEYILLYVTNTKNVMFNLEHMYEEFGLVQLFTKGIQVSRTSKAVIIFIDVFDELCYIINKNTTLWDQGSIFVIVLQECFLEIQLEMEALWKHHKIYKYVLVCGQENPVMYIYRPFVKDGEKRVFTVENETEIVDNIVHATDNLHGSVIRVVLFPQDFFAITENGKYIGGGDYSPLEILQKKMNFHPLIFPPTDGNKYTQDGKNISGSMRDIVLGVADIALNGFILKDYGTDAIKLSRFVYMDKLCLIVPMPSYNSPYTLIMQIFSKSIWLLITLVYFTTIFLYHAFEKFNTTKQQQSEFKDLWLQAFAIFIFGATSLKSNSTPTKLLLGGLLLNVLIINNIFQGCLMTVLSKPTRKQTMETLNQVLKSDLVLGSKNIERLINDRKLLQCLYRLKERKHSENINYVKIKRFPYLHAKNFRNHLRYENNVTEAFHIVSEHIKSNLLSFVFPKNSPLLDRINFYLFRFHEIGLTSKWLGRDVSLMVQAMYKPLDDNKLSINQDRSFTLKDLYFIFTLLLVGLGLSTVVFILENLLGNKKD